MCACLYTYFMRNLLHNVNSFVHITYTFLISYYLQFTATEYRTKLINNIQIFLFILISPQFHQIICKFLTFFAQTTLYSYNIFICMKNLFSLCDLNTWKEGGYIQSYIKYTILLLLLVRDKI